MLKYQQQSQWGGTFYVHAVLFAIHLLIKKYKLLAYIVFIANSLRHITL